MQDSNLRLMGLYDLIFLDVMTRDFYFETTRSATELIPIILPRLGSNQHVRIFNGREHPSSCVYPVSRIRELKKPFSPLGIFKLVNSCPCFKIYNLIDVAKCCCSGKLFVAGFAVPCQVAVKV